MHFACFKGFRPVAHYVSLCCRKRGTLLFRDSLINDIAGQGAMDW